MIAAWMLMSLLLGAASALGAIALDGVCRALRVSRRWTWGGALAALVALTILVPLRRAGDTGTLRLPATFTITGGSAKLARPSVISPARLIAAARTLIDAPISALAGRAQHVVSPAVDRWLLDAWIVTSASLLLLGVVVYRRLRLAQRTWPVSSLQGERVHVAPNAGPATLGFLRGSIVVPPWLVECAADTQQVVLAHEREHVRARDPMFLTLAAASVMLLPWNPAAWWMLAQLRLAVELDCDRRVLDRGVRTREYGSLLIDLAGRTAGLPLAAPLVGLTMLAERTTHLERRIVAMSAPRPRHLAARIAAGSLVALAAALVACESHLPTEPQVNNMTAASAQQAATKVGIMSADDSLTTFYIDGNVAAATAARALSPERVATVRVQRDATGAGKSTMWITTRDSSAAAAGVRTFRMKEVSGHAQLAFAGLVFIDGKQVDQSAMKQLSPGSIQSIEVIKGARAAELYPNEPAAAQGVIQITTKHGAQ